MSPRRFVVCCHVSVSLALVACAGTDAEVDTDAGGTDTPSSSGPPTASGNDTSASASGSGSDGTGNVDDSGSDETGDAPTTGGTDSTTGGTVDPPALCEDIELPVRDGAEIIVTPAGDGQVTVGGQTMTLRAAVSMASPGDTVLLEDGTYTLPDAPSGDYTGVFITTENITVRSASGNADAVVIDGAYRSMGDGGVGNITIDAPGVVLAHVTVTRSVFHLVHIWADGDGALIHDVRMIDGGQQFLKSSVGDGSVDDVEISCSQFSMTDEGRDNVWGYGPSDGGTTCYTGGIDTHNARNWSVHDSRFEGIYCTPDGVQRPAHGRFPEQRDNMTYNGGLSEHGIHMWDSEQGTGHDIVRNQIVDCARGIGLGLTEPVFGGRIVNNTVSSSFAGSREHDVGIIVERASGTLVAHNTVIFTHPDAYPNAIEYRWPQTDGSTSVYGNLTNQLVRERDGATADVRENVADAGAELFVDAEAGDLHLVDCGAVNGISPHAEVVDDLDGDPRSDPTPVGADDC